MGVNADQIDDGAVYFIHSASNSNLVWDVPANNYSNGTAPILYSKLGGVINALLCMKKLNIIAKRITP